MAPAQGSPAPGSPAPGSPAPGGARAARWGDLRLRVASALVLAPLALAAIWIGGAVFAGLIGVVALGLGIEWTRLCGAAWGGSRLAGLGWIVLAGVALVWLRADPVAGRINVLFLVLAVWASDVGAYLAGRLIGGPRLAPRLSPGKTWAGAVGGLVTAALMGTAVALICTAGHDPAALARAAALGAAVSVLGQGGDLAESCAKRCFGVKDSGRLIPGHGGLLDRLDAVLAVIPVAALLAYLLGPGVVLWR